VKDDYIVRVGQKLTLLLYTEIEKLSTWPINISVCG